MGPGRVAVSYRLPKVTKRLLERLARKLDRSQTWVMKEAVERMAAQEFPPKQEKQ